MEILAQSNSVGGGNGSNVSGGGNGIPDGGGSTGGGGTLWVRADTDCIYTFKTKANGKVSLSLVGFGVITLQAKIIEKNNQNNGKPYLIYRYFAFSCNSCVDFGNEKLGEIFIDSQYDQNILVVISDYPTSHNETYSNFLYLGKEKLGLALEQTHIPFYFLFINERVEHVFM